MEPRKCLFKAKHLEELEEEENSDPGFTSSDVWSQPGTGEEGDATSGSRQQLPKSCKRRRAQPSASSSASSQLPLDLAAWPPLPHPTPSSSSSSARLPTRVTLQRRKKKEAKDRELLAQTDQAMAPGNPCNVCGQPQHLDSDHAFYRGRFFCPMEDKGKRTSEQWLRQQWESNSPSVPRTTSWRIRKRVGEEQEEGRQVPARKTHKPHKIHICQLCGLPMTKDYGHSLFSGLTSGGGGKTTERFCAMSQGLHPDLWLARKRARQRENN
ncbi:uncharacterized protein ACBR49_016466 [Aulostomus maculatus]